MYLLFLILNIHLGERVKKEIVQIGAYKIKKQKIN